MSIRVRGTPPSIDNDNDLVWGNGRKTTDNLYSIDAPGLKAWYSTAAGLTVFTDKEATDFILSDFVARDNLFDFVRIKTGTRDWAMGPGIQGSRTSVFYSWHSMTHIQPAGPAATKRFTDPATPPGKTENEIEPGLIDVDLIGG